MSLANKLSDPRPAFTESARRLADHIRLDHLRLGGFGDERAAAFSVAAKLQRSDPFLDNTDALIIATAIVDEEADHLYATERLMLESTSLRDAIRRICEERGRTILDIREPETYPLRKIPRRRSRQHRR